MADLALPIDSERQGAERYIAAFREHWLLIAALVLVAVVAAAVYSSAATKRYEASADLLVSPVPSDDETFLGINLLRESTDPQSRTVLTAARLVRTPEIATEVGDRLGLEDPLDSIEIRPQGQSSIITLVGEAETAERAAAIANTFADVLVARRTAQFQGDLETVIQRLERRLRGVEFGSIEGEAIQTRLAELRSLLGTSDPTLQVTSRAVPPDNPVWPRPKLSIAVALLAALLLGGGVALGLELLSPRVKREEELLLEHRLPILTRVPRLPTRIARGYLSRREPLPGEVWEAYRTLRASLTTAGADGTFPRTVLVTSAMPGEGKTMTSVNLSVTLALAGMRVVLVDGDLRRPMVAPVFGVAAGREGFAGLLLGKSPALAPAPGHGDRLRLLLAAPEHAQLIDLLEPRRVKAALDRLVADADVVVIDSPPLTEVADALPLADAAEAVVVATRLGHTRRDKLNDLRRMLAQHGVLPTGVVVTSRRATRGGRYYSYSATRDQRPTPQEEAPAHGMPAAAPQPPSVEAPAPAASAAPSRTARRRRAASAEPEPVPAQAGPAPRAEELAAATAEIAAREEQVARGESELANERAHAESRRLELDHAEQRAAEAARDLAQQASELKKQERSLAKRAERLAARESEIEQRLRQVEQADERAKAAAREQSERAKEMQRRERELERLRERLTEAETEAAAASAERPARRTGLRALLSGGREERTRSVANGRSGQNGGGYDMSLVFRLESSSGEAASRFANDLASYIQGIYAGELAVERVDVSGEAAPFDMSLSFHAYGLTEDAAQSFGSDLAAYVVSLYGGAVEPGEVTVSPRET